MCPILDGYGVMTVFLIPVHALVWTASISWQVAIFSQLQTERSRDLDTWVVRKACSYVLPARFATERQPVLRPAVAFSKTSFKHRSIQIKGNFTKLTSHLYFKRIMYYAGLLFCSVYCQ